MSVVGATNYFGKPYIMQNELHKITSVVRKHLKTGKFHIIICSEKYVNALFRFIKNTVPVDNIKNIKLFNVPSIYADKRRNDESILDKSCYYLQSNSLMTKDILRETFSSLIIEEYRHITNEFDFVFPEYKISSPNDVVENSLFGSFDQDTALVSPSIIPNLSSGNISDDDMKHIFPIIPNYVNENYFFTGVRNFLSLKNEIETVVHRQLN